MVEFDGVPATGCTQSGGTTITCTGTPPHAPGAAQVRVRNPDTRATNLSSNYTFVSGTPRTTSLTAAKSGSDVVITWICTGCTVASPARLYRAQNTVLSQYLEIYNGGISGTYTNTGAAASAQSYFWNVE